jgi:hypothetical protein
VPDTVQSDPVTFEQEAMWLHDYLYNGQSLYLESWVCRLRGTLDIAAVDWTINQIVTRHSALHSGIRLEGRRLVQVLRPGLPVVVEWLPGFECSLDEDLQRLVRRPLDLSASPMRVTCLEVGAGDVVLVWQLHHLVADDWALSILEREFQEFYCARVDGRPAELPALPMQPGAYAAAQRRDGINPELADYWRKHLVNAPGESTLRPDRPPPEAPSHRGGLIRFRVGADLGNGIRSLARQSRTTPFTVAAAAVAALLWGCNGSEDQVLGTPVSRRGAVNVNLMFTCLTDLLPLRLHVRAEDSFGELIKSTKLAISGTLAHRDIPFSHLLRECGYPRSSPRPLLCQVILVVDDIPKADLDLPGLRAERLYVNSGISKFDLEIALVLEGAGYQGFLRYARDLFSAETARDILAGFRALLEGAVDQPSRPLGTMLGVLPPPLRPGTAG